MTTLVLDASVLAKVYSPIDERHTDVVEGLVERWDAGSVEFVGPDLLRLEIMNVAARKWRLPEAALRELIASVDSFVTYRPYEPHRVAYWSSRGLTAYDAAYVAVAEALDVPLVTDDDQIAGVAPDLAHALATFAL